MQKLLSLGQDLSVLRRLVFPSHVGATHAERLDSFYRSQARHYDSFRERLLPYRRELLNRAIPDGFSGVWVDLGGGTGYNAEMGFHRLAEDARVWIVDLCPSLLEIARERSIRLGPKKILPVHADATTFALPEGYADLVTMSFSLTMIPQWWEAIANAIRILRPGGTLAVVDFTVPLTPHSLEARFWSRWFKRDGVHLSAAHHQTLRTNLKVEFFHQGAHTLPYLPFLRAPFYAVVGTTHPSPDSPRVRDHTSL